MKRVNLDIDTSKIGIKVSKSDENSDLESTALCKVLSQVDCTLLVDKYKPSSLYSIIGQQGER